MKYFSIALADVLAHEGGYVDSAADNGGATHYGISLRFLRTLPALAGDINNDGHVSAEDIQALTPATAADFYRRYFWDHYRLGEIQDLDVATKLFNFFVNMRGKTAALIAQRAVNDLGHNLYLDGIAGSKTLAALNACCPNELLPCIKWRAWEVYREIVATTPSQAVFANGWRKRAFA
jgi:lysozyme family protein